MSTTMTLKQAEGKRFKYDVKADYRDNPSIHYFYEAVKNHTLVVEVRIKNERAQYWWTVPLKSAPRWENYFTDTDGWNNMKKYLTLEEQLDVELMI